MTQSLKRRMLTASVAWIVLAWSASLVAVYLYTAYSQSSIWDDRLRSIASKLLEIVPGDVASSALLQSRSAEARDELTFQIWRDQRDLLASTTGAPKQALNASFTNGFATVPVGGGAWRVYSASSGSIQVQVGAPRAMINADFRRHALRAVSLAALPLALSGLLLWWSVQRALQPVRRIEATARARSISDLTPLPTEGLPSELQPLVQSFNHLLTQLDSSIQTERRFIGDAAHELRTPLSALHAQLEVAMRATSMEEKNVALGKLQVAVQRSIRLSEQLLDLARLEAGARVPLRDWHALDEIVRHVASEFEIGARLQERRMELTIEPCRIHCDMDEIGILVRNLVDNALRYTLTGGTVLISCGHSSSHVFVQVADDGPGVPIEERSAIFERFRRATRNNAVRGSGIGLSLVAKIAALHHAQIETDEGTGGRGLTVRVLFQPSA
ncbi:MAG: ATP-binding protein [Steroidobacter sp.]